MKIHVKCATTVGQHGEIWLPLSPLKTGYLMRSDLFLTYRILTSDLTVMCWSSQIFSAGFSGEGDLWMSFDADSANLLRWPKSKFLVVRNSFLNWRCSGVDGFPVFVLVVDTGFLEELNTSLPPLEVGIAVFGPPF
jgi:hypothetical protein